MQRERGRETQVGVMNGKTGAGKKNYREDGRADEGDVVRV